MTKTVTSDTRPTTIASLHAAYAAGSIAPLQVAQVARRQAAADRSHTWISLLPVDRIARMVEALGAFDPVRRPLYGVPFGIKDNIDVADIATTAGCDRWSRLPETSADCVARLVGAGAIPIGKTNMDQFATGLVGTRSPFGVVRNARVPSLIAGGSSSGSATAVATGAVTFALGTDTAGSGRVPAAFNDLVGLKPSRGLISTDGVVPACRSLDCISIFGNNVADVALVFAILADVERDDGFVRPAGRFRDGGPSRPRRIGVPPREQLDFDGDREYERLYVTAVARWRQLGAKVVERDFRPFRDAATLLYEGPWLAERLLAARAILPNGPDDLQPLTRGIVAAGGAASALDAFAASYTLAALRRHALDILRDVDAMLTPTAPTIYAIDTVLADPLGPNRKLGTYTNFMNLLDLACVAIPAGYREDGAPFGVSLFSRHGSDQALLRLARLFLEEAEAVPADIAKFSQTDGPRIDIAVCGAHLQGMALNAQLTDRGARLRAATTTSADYRLYVLAGGPVKRPALVRVPAGGHAIDVEIWSLPASRFAEFVDEIRAPLGIGKVTTAAGEEVCGFICAEGGVAGAEDISRFGGWRAYVAAADGDHSV